MMNIQEKLLAIQFDLRAPKNQKNKFGNYNYRSVEDILEAVKPLLKEQGTTLTLTDEPVMIGDRIYINATATLRDIEDATQFVVVTGYARESAVKKGMDDSQVTGSTSSYARKYALNGLFLIDDSKDADTNEYAKQNESNRTQSKTNNQKPHNELNSYFTLWVKKLQESKGQTEAAVYSALNNTFKVANLKAFDALDDANKQTIIKWLKTIAES
ncbi:ERF family protein [Weissella diestrammenae]|uniref:ERF family protein n=1 Tax=Weissella diestrammenae TaxID=1162633 RepID=A0A7G9T4N7_9LACO|nr:ERF family protein [Weissella diestrammenae]MCM0582164.1 ERF family protein [Weissella diestrammenae]QNN75062.1 ERF family protein [Weissella diestrammenae]